MSESVQEKFAAFNGVLLGSLVGVVAADPRGIDPWPIAVGLTLISAVWFAGFFYANTIRGLVRTKERLLKALGDLEEKPWRFHDKPLAIMVVVMLAAAFYFALTDTPFVSLLFSGMALFLWLVVLYSNTERGRQERVRDLKERLWSVEKDIRAYEWEFALRMR